MNPLEVYKKLPRNNCGKCSAGTCMSFAVQFLGGMISVSECPELDEESRRIIGAMHPRSGDWKERRLQELFQEISVINFSDIAEGTGTESENGDLKIKYMGREILLSHSGFHENLDIWDRLLILMYVKNAGSGNASGKWVAFRDLKDGLIRAESFRGACETSLARLYEHHKGEFLVRLTALGAEKVSGFSAEHSFVIHTLPKIPFLVLLWPGDEDFGPDCKVLLDSTAAEFLDVEALLYLGMALVRALK